VPRRHTLSVRKSLKPPEVCALFVLDLVLVRSQVRIPAKTLSPDSGPGKRNVLCLQFTVVSQAELQRAFQVHTPTARFGARNGGTPTVSARGTLVAHRIGVVKL
jgi:hypothetical protein